MTIAMSTDDRLYFRQLLSGRDFATADPMARQMVNFAYLIGDREAGEAVVVDPAYDVGGLVDALEADGMRCTGVLATHYHPDHVGGSMMGFQISGAKELLELVSVPVHAQRDEARFIAEVTGLGDDEIIGHDSGDVVSIGAIDIELIHTPGHTPGSVCFRLEGSPLLFSGDTLFPGGPGATGFEGGDFPTIIESIDRRLFAPLDPGTVVMPGHGLDTTIGTESPSLDEWVARGW